MAWGTRSESTRTVKCVVHSGDMDVRAETRRGGCDDGGEGRWAGVVDKGVVRSAGQACEKRSVVQRKAGQGSGRAFACEVDGRAAERVSWLPDPRCCASERCTVCSEAWGSGLACVSRRAGLSKRNAAPRQREVDG